MKRPLKKLTPGAEKVLDEFTGKEGIILHIWESEEAPDYVVFTIVHIHGYNNMDMSFYRLFTIADNWQISVDRELRMDGGTGSYTLAPAYES